MRRSNLWIMFRLIIPFPAPKINFSGNTLENFSDRKKTGAACAAPEPEFSSDKRVFEIFDLPFVYGDDVEADGDLAP